MQFYCKNYGEKIEKKNTRSTSALGKYSNTLFRVFVFKYLICKKEKVFVFEYIVFVFEYIAKVFIFMNTIMNTFEILFLIKAFGKLNSSIY